MACGLEDFPHVALRPAPLSLRVRLGTHVLRSGSGPDDFDRNRRERADRHGCYGRGAWNKEVPMTDTSGHAMKGTRSSKHSGQRYRLTSSLDLGHWRHEGGVRQQLTLCKVAAW